jgi:TolA-binding protein
VVERVKAMEQLSQQLSQQEQLSQQRQQEQRHAEQLRNYQQPPGGGPSGHPVAAAPRTTAAASVTAIQPTLPLQ